MFHATYKNKLEFCTKQNIRQIHFKYIFRNSSFDLLASAASPLVGVVEDPFGWDAATCWRRAEVAGVADAVPFEITARGRIVLDGA